MKYILIFFSLLAGNLCAQEIRFNDILIDTAYSFRGLSVVDDNVAWLGGTNGIVGATADGGKTWDWHKVKGFDKSDFRSVYAFDKNTAIIANAGSPACILRTEDGGVSWKEVYRNTKKEAFIDGIDFWNEQEGMVYGDPVYGKMLLLKTNDAGLTWNALEGPVMMEGEASFAASGTTIRCLDKSKIIIASGGKRSGLFISGNKGSSWNFMPVPIVQGDLTEGIFSVTDAGAKGLIVVGGDFANESYKEKHVLYSTNSGKKWNAPKNPTGGYRECVEMISTGCALAVGPGGADVSTDNGKNWKSIENARNFHVVRKARNGKLVIAAGHKRVSIVEITL